ncbi:hypothetical protein Tco_1217953 [Tanacetum coccineum]
MEGLHVALMEETQSGLIRGIKIDSSNITLSHIFYVDDVVITTEWSSLDIDNIIRVLHVFYLASGLKINIHKSNVYGVGVPDNEVGIMANNTGCTPGSFPFVFLVIKALHGHEGGFGLNDNTSNGIWSKIVGSSNYLHSNDILSSDSIRHRVGCDCLISERFINNHWTWNWSRPILGTHNLAYLNDLINEINPIELSTDLDA